MVLKKCMDEAKRWPCIGDLILAIEDIVSGLLRNCKRRRNSYRLHSYFNFIGCICLAYSISSGVLWGYMWARLLGTRKDCVLPKSDYDLQLSTQMKDYVKERRRAFTCADENWAVEAMACELSEIRGLQNTMIVSCIVNAIQSFFCLLLSYGFSYFSNLPASSLASGRATRKMMWCGGFCKHGPWIVRLVHFTQFLIWLTFVVELNGRYKCKGDTTFSYDCANGQNDCAYTQLLNCRYYWGSQDCAAQYKRGVQQENLLDCFVPDNRDAFSGAVDVRLITDSACVRCALLHQDLETKDNDDFDLRDIDSNDKQDWCMQADPTSCFQLKKIHLLPLYCACPRDMAARVTEEERTKYGLSPENCAEVGRRLDQETEGKSQKDSAEDPRENVEDLASDARTMRPFADLEDLMDPYPIEAPRALAPERASRNETVQSIIEYFETLAKTDPLGGEDTWGINSMWDRDEVCISGTDDTDLCNQECSWAPKGIPDFYFQKTNCEQAGSFMYRYCTMYTYSFGCGWLVMTMVGIIMRITSTPETWFFNPHEANELFFWQWLRYTGP